MKKEEFLLIKLAEECSEVSKRAMKQIQFGANQVQTGGEVKDGVPAPVDETGLTNAERLVNEILDFGIIVELLHDLGQIPEPPTDFDFHERIEAKKQKLNKYLAFARSLGQIDGDWTI